MENKPKSRKQLLKSLPIDDVILINKIKERLESLKYRHAQDSIHFGESMAETRRKLRARIKTIEDIHIASQGHKE